MAENVDWGRYYEEQVKPSLSEELEQERNRLHSAFEDRNDSVYPREDLPVTKQILSLAVGAAVAHLAGVRSSESFTLEEAYEKIDAKNDTIRGSISNWKGKGFLLRPEKSTYRIDPTKISDILDEIL